MNNKHRETDHSAGRDFLSLDVEILKSTLSSVGIESIRDQNQHLSLSLEFRQNLEVETVKLARLEANMTSS